MCNANSLPTRRELKLARSGQMFDQRIAAAPTPDKQWAAILGELRAVYANAGDEDRALMAAQVRAISRAQRDREGTKARGRARVRAA